MIIDFDKINLKPCPFCGTEKIMFTYWDATKTKMKRFEIACSKCGIRTGVLPVILYEATIEKWNARVATPYNVGKKKA